MSTQQDDLSVLVPMPSVFKVGSEEIRIQPLPNRRLIGIVNYVEKNKDLMDKAGKIMEVGVSAFLENEVYKRLNDLLRLVVSPVDKHAFLTDEWCGNNLSNAHYRAIFMTVLRQNELESVFIKAKDFLALHVEGSLRQAVQSGALFLTPKEPPASA